MYDYEGNEITGWQLNPNKSIREDVFVLKADVASSCKVNNIVSQQFAQDNSPVETPRQLANSEVIQANFGYPIAVWWRDSDDVDTFLGAYNLNTGKDSADYYQWNEKDIYFS